MDERKKTHLFNIIMGTSRHQFIYGYKGKKREQFLKEMAERYPVQLDTTNPIGIYLDSIGLPKVDTLYSDFNSEQLSIICREYLNFSIIKNLFDVTFEQLSEKDLNEKTHELLSVVDHFIISNKKLSISSLKELSDFLNDVRNAYAIIHNDYIKSNSLNGLLKDLPIIRSIDRFIRGYKEVINSNSHIGVIIDSKEPISLRSQRAINHLVASRINADISMKVACEPDSWETKYDLDGNLINATHDYGTVKIDDSHDEYIKRLFKL